MNEAPKPLAGERRWIKRNANLKDLTGYRFHGLVVLREARGRLAGKKWESMWYCRCDCGNEIEARTRCLKAGLVKSCGCLRRQYLDIFGKRFGRLFVIYGPRHNSGGTLEWKCQCDCGESKWVSSHALVSMGTASCGCLKRERTAERHTTHGLSQSKIAQTYYRIKARTSNPNHSDYHHYGGRGIGMHPAWASSFEAFLRDVGFPPTQKHSLDRIDNEKGYAPGNVRWATQAEQVRNTRRTLRVVVDGVELCLKDACEKMGISYKAIIKRKQQGMSVEEALSTPVMRRASIPKSMRNRRIPPHRFTGLRAGVFARDGNKCVKCGSSEKLNADHIVAIANGGTNNVSNFQTLCQRCNCSKGAWVFPTPS